MSDANPKLNTATVMKILALGLDPAATDAEASVAAVKAIQRLRASGVDIHQFRTLLGEPRSNLIDPGQIVMPVGKHGGRKLADILRTHPGYLWWGVDNFAEKMPTLAAQIARVLGVEPHGRKPTKRKERGA